MDLQLPESDDGSGDIELRELLSDLSTALMTTASLIISSLPGDTELRERLSDCQHEIWAHWMRYLFYTSIPLDDGGVKITAENFQRWQRQAVTPYSELSEKEKDSDREQADKVLMVLGGKASN